MVRALATALLCAAAMIAGDLVFRRSLLSQVRPIILVPLDQQIMQPPVQVSWEGPPQMRLLLSVVGEEQHDLGVQESPFEIDGDQFPREGGYQIELQAPRFGSWIWAVRRFQVHAAAAPPATTQAAPACGARDLVHALEAARSARDRAQDRLKFLREENRTLRAEGERLAKELETVYKSQDDDAARAAALEQRLDQLAGETRTLADENAAMRLRLSNVIPCSVWGYYSFPRVRSSEPMAVRLLMVSDGRGQVLRTQPACELLRRSDSGAASICFCVGNSWGG